MRLRAPGHGRRLHVYSLRAVGRSQLGFLSAIGNRSKTHERALAHSGVGAAPVTGINDGTRGEHLPDPQAGLERPGKSRRDQLLWPIQLDHRLRSTTGAFRPHPTANHHRPVHLEERKLAAGGFLPADSPTVHQRAHFALERSYNRDLGPWSVGQCRSRRPNPDKNRILVFRHSGFPETTAPRAAKLARPEPSSIPVPAPPWPRKQTFSCVPCAPRRWWRVAPAETGDR